MPQDAVYALINNLDGTSATDDGPRRRALFTDGRRALGCGSQLARVAIDVRPRVVRITQPRWSPRPDGRLPLRQELRKVGAAATDRP